MDEVVLERNEVKGFFNRMANCWDEICVFNWTNINRILTLAGIAEGDRVIDVGCGTGVLVESLLKRGVEEIYAIDLSDEMIRRAKAKHHHPAVSFEAADFLLTDKRGYDCVIVHNAYPHFMDKTDLADRKSVV